MKKAQILSALALAFALGVVAPVVSTTNTVSAFTVADANADPAVEGEATKAEVEAAVAAVEANTTYKNMVALSEAIDEIDNGDYKNIALGAMNSVTGPLKTINGATGKLAKEATDYVADYSANKLNVNYATAFEHILGIAEKVPYYAVYAAIQDAGQVSDKDFSKSNYNKVVDQLNVALKKEGLATVGVISANSTDAEYTTLQSNVNTALNGLIGDTAENSSAMSTAYGNIYAAAENYSKYTEGYNLIVNALKASGVLSTDGNIALETALKNKTTAIALADLADIVDTAKNANNYAAWVTGSASVKAELEDAANGASTYDVKGNYGLVIDLATAYRTATGTSDAQTIEQVAQTLVGYKAPAEEAGNATVTDGPVSVTGKFDASSIKVKATKSDKKVAAFGDANYAMWDIILTDNAGNKVNVEGSVMVTIDVPEGIDGAKSSIYYVTEDGKVEKLAARYENGKMSFTVSHFSLYAIVEDNGKNFGISAPDTGVLATAEGSASTTVAMVAGIATALTAAGAGVVAYRNARRSTRK